MVAGRQEVIDIEVAAQTVDTDFAPTVQQVADIEVAVKSVAHIDSVQSVPSVFAIDFEGLWEGWGRRG